MRQLVALVFALLMSACNGSDPASESERENLGPLAGVVGGVEFAVTNASARRLSVAGSVAVDLADYAMTCADAQADAEPGSRFVSLVLNTNVSPGEYPLGVGPDQAASVSVTTWEHEPTTGWLLARTTVIGNGVVEIASVGDGAISGQVDVEGSADTALRGTFDAQFCPSP